MAETYSKMGYSHNHCVGREKNSTACLLHGSLFGHYWSGENSSSAMGSWPGWLESSPRELPKWWKCSVSRNGWWFCREIHLQKFIKHFCLNLSYAIYLLSFDKRSKSWKSEEEKQHWASQSEWSGGEGGRKPEASLHSQFLLWLSHIHGLVGCTSPPWVPASSAAKQMNWISRSQSFPSP